MIYDNLFTNSQIYGMKHKIMDQTDRKILQALQQDGRMTNQQLSEVVGVSSAACWRRTKAMEDAGIIRKYMAVLDAKSVGQDLCVFTHISLTRHSRENAEKFSAAARDRAEIQECYAVTGDADFMLRVMVPDIEAYDKFLEGFLFNIDGISQVRSNFALREIKYDTSLPV